MYQVILCIHVLVAICLIALVLVQQGKGAMVGSAFGSGASQTVFGSRGAGSLMLRLTLSFVAVFFITSIMLNWLTSHRIKHQQSTLPAVFQQVEQQSQQISAEQSKQSAATDLPIPKLGSAAEEKTILPDNPTPSASISEKKAVKH